MESKIIVFLEVFYITFNLKFLKGKDHSFKNIHFSLLELELVLFISISLMVFSMFPFTLQVFKMYLLS